jgi:hypothetical protein
MEEVSIPSIETALPGKWETDNHSLFLVFEPAASGKGNMEAISNVTKVQYKYEVCMKGNNPCLDLTDETKHETYEYEIAEIDADKNVLRLKRESKPELILHKRN